MDEMNVSVNDAAVMLGLSPQSLRMWLRSHHCPFGDAWEGTGKNFDYYVNGNRLKNYLAGTDMKKAAQPETSAA